MSGQTIDLHPILALHREPDSYIAFGSKRPDRPGMVGNLFSVRSDELWRMFPQMHGWLLRDSYFTINGFYRAGYWVNSQTKLPDAHRLTRDVRYINSCYADIDCGRPDSAEPGAGLDFRETQKRVGLLVDAGVLPQPSMTARSGRGVYVFWFLVDPDTGRRPRNAPWRVEAFRQINIELQDRLRRYQLPADPHSNSITQYLRVPGTIHTGVNRPAVYTVELDAQGKGYVYTIHQLAAFVGLKTMHGGVPRVVEQLCAPPKWRTTKARGTAPARSAGAAKVNAMRAADMRTIAEWRGGIRQRGDAYADGYVSCGRRWFLDWYANCLAGSHAPEHEALAAVQACAAACVPAYPSKTDDPPVADLVGQYYRPRARRHRMTSAKLCAALGVTAQVAQDLGLASIKPPAEAAADRDARPDRSEYIRARRQYLLGVIEQLPGAWTLARVRGLRHETYSWPSNSTASRDLAAIGYADRTPRRGRPRATTASLL